MTGGLRSLRDLVEEGAASHGIGLRTLWGWALDAIVAGSLIPVLPTGVSLDTPFDNGGMSLSWRKVISTASRSITRYIPENDNWANTLMFHPDTFDKWFTHDSPARTHRSRSPLPIATAELQSRQRPAEKRAKTALNQLYPDGRLPDEGALPNKMFCDIVLTQLKNSKELSVSPATILRAAGRLQRRRRPRK
jgi:hypothetical protein